MWKGIVVVLGASLLHSAAAQGTSGGSFVFVQGQALAVLETNTSSSLQAAVTANAPSTLALILQQKAGATGSETFSAGKRSNTIVVDKKGRKHIRLEQTYQGIQVVDAAMVMHVDAQGQVFAVNGEFVADGSLNVTEVVSCLKAFAHTRTDPKYGPTAVWLTAECQLRVVFDKYGTAHMAWERTIGYQPTDTGPYQNDKLYASVVTGEIVAVRPQIFGALSLNTQNCHQSTATSSCSVVSTSPGPINTTDLAIQDAHKFSRATYNFYYNSFGRDSIDGKGMTIVSHVHVGVNYNNAYWSGTSLSMNYGKCVCACLV
jgi:Zn-dependent metalloprotease